MSTPAQVPMFSPQGEFGYIPADKVDAAISAGGQMAHQLKAPDGSLGYVPHSKLGAALQAGGVPQSQAPQQPAYSLSNQPPSDIMHPINWMQNAISDVEQGGNSTFIGKLLGRMQGRGDQGYSGVNAGPNANVNGRVGQGTVGDMVASPILGPMHAIRGTLRQLDPNASAGERLAGAGEGLSGALQTATIPSAFMAPEAAEGLSQLTPKAMAARAGQKFQAVAQTMGDAPVVNTYRPLSAALRGEELAERGGSAAKPLADFARDVSGSDAIPWQEARDFYSNSGNPSIMDRLSTSGPMKRQLAIFRSELGNSLQEAADNGNVGEVYRSALTQYRNAMVLQKIGRVGAALAAFEAADQILGGRVTSLLKKGATALP